MKKLIVLMVAVMFVGFASAQTRTSMKTADLKKDITDHIAKTYPGYAIKEAFKIETNKVITYEVLVQKETSKMTLVYNDKGGFLKMENMKPMTGTKTNPATKKTTTTTTKSKTGTK